MKKRHILLRLIFIVLNNLYSIPVYLMWMLLIRPLKFIYRPLYYYIEGTLYSWLLEMVAYWIHSNNVHVHETGDDITECHKSHSLVVCNHQSTSDVPLLMYYLSSKGNVVNKMCWIMNIMFKYTNFGWVSQVHHDFFIKEGKATRDQQIDLLKNYLSKIYIRLNRKWLILFPEGGFFYKRKEVSKKYAAKNDFPKLDHCSLPRTGALQAILSILMPVVTSTNSSTPATPQGANNLRSSIHSNTGHLEWFIDLTILYPNGYALSIFDLICRRRVEPLHIGFVTRKYDIKKLASLSEEQFQDWFFGMWKEKDVLMHVFYNEGIILDPKQIAEGKSLEDLISANENQKEKKAEKVVSETDSKEEDSHSSDGEEGYTGIDTEFLESFKRSWREDDEDLNGREILPEVSLTTEIAGKTIHELPTIKMNYTRMIALHFFFLLSVYLHYTIIKTLVHTIFGYVLMSVG